MQLILVDAKGTEDVTIEKIEKATWSRDGSILISVRGEILCPKILKRKLNQNLSDEDMARNKLISEIIPGDDPRFLFVDMSPFVDPKDKTVKIHLKSPVFKALWNMFREQVNISVSLRNMPSRKKGLADFESVHGMIIDASAFDCKGSMRMSSKDNANKFVDVPVQVKVVADVPDSYIFASKITYAKKLLEKEKFSDVVITAGNGAQIKAHKSFLSVCSPVLEAMFDTDMEESKTGRVDMSDVSEAAVKAFLRYVYYGDLAMPKESAEVAFQVLYASHKYHVRPLEAEMITCLIESKNEDFDVGLAFKIYMFTRNVENSLPLKTKAVQILKTNLDELESLQEYKDLFLKSSNANIAMEICREFAKSSSA